MKRILTILTIALLLLSFNSIAFAKGQEGKPSTPAVIADALVLRPLGFAGTVLGTAAFVASLPVTLSFHKSDQVEQVLVKDPFKYTFERPIGAM